MSRTRRTLGARANSISQQVFGRPVGQIAAPGLSVTPQFNEPAPREALPHFWHPKRDGIEQAPADFVAKLKAIHPDLELTRPPGRAPVRCRCWLLWFPKPTITHPLCPGWQLLMGWQVNGHPLPLDERLFAAIYHFDARRHSSAVAYFDKIIAERDRDRALREKHYKSDLHAQTKEYRDSLKISTAGRGNRFALHHDGTLMPSKGEINWTIEHQRHTLPESIRREERERREQQRS